MEGYKGYEKGLICRGKQYAVGETYEEPTAEICKSGMHFCALPHQVFEHYCAGANHEFTRVEALDEVFTDDNRKFCTKKLKIGEKISVFDICKISVGAFFEKFDFQKKIASADANQAGNCGAARAGNYGAANAGDYGAARAGACGAARAGDYGAANAGYRGAANAGYRGAANAGNYGAANAGNYGAAIVRNYGSASVGKNGVAIGLGNGSSAKGALNAILVLVSYDDDGNVSAYKAIKVDGKRYKADTYYTLNDDGKIVEWEKEQ